MKSRKTITTAVVLWSVIALSAAAILGCLSSSLCLDGIVAKAETQKLSGQFDTLGQMVAPITLNDFATAGESSGDKVLFGVIDQADLKIKSALSVRIALQKIKANRNIDAAVFHVDGGQAQIIASTFAVSRWLGAADLARVAGGETVSVDGGHDSAILRVVAKPVYDDAGAVVGISVLAHDRTTLIQTAQTTHGLLFGLILLITFGVAAIASAVTSIALPNQFLAATA